MAKAKKAKKQGLTSREKRFEVLAALEKERRSRVITYITGDRQGLATRISSDVFPMIHQHLVRMGHQPRIDMFLYSPGGLTISGYALVNLIREFCDEFNVIVPFKAHSTATLICLGANEILMTKMGQLSPIDPSVQHPLGPTFNPAGQPQILPVNVEDVTAFFNLAKSGASLDKEESKLKAFEILAGKVHPIVLGAVHRSREQIAFLATQLMAYHTKDPAKVKRTVDTLTRERFSHDYIISPREAKELLGLKITEPNGEVSKLVVDLFNAYNSFLELDQPYSQETVLGAEETVQATFDRAVIESAGLTHIFRSVKVVSRIQVPQGPHSPLPVTGYQERTLREQWVMDSNR